MVQAIINTRSITSMTATTASTSYNTDSTICRSNLPTSSEVKCTLPSSLVNFKSIKAVSLTNIPSAFAPHVTNMHLRIDHDFTVAGNYLPKGISKTIHLEGNAYWSLSGTTITENGLISPTLPNNNIIEAVIPPASCFNLTLKESITTLDIQFTAIGVLKSEIDNTILNPSLALSGTIIANILGIDSSEVSPCN